MAKRSTAHTASAHDSTAPDDSTIPLGEVPEATEVLGAMRIVMGLPLYAAGIWLAWRVSDPAETS